MVDLNLIIKIIMTKHHEGINTRKQQCKLCNGKLIIVVNFQVAYEMIHGMPKVEH
jgi:hypothetical protein